MPSQPQPKAEPHKLTSGDALILGVIQGITEFLPVSSTGHIIIANTFLHLDSKEPLYAADGSPLWYKKPTSKNPEGERLTVKRAADTYVIVLQFGAIAAVAGLYWPQFRRMILGLLGRDKEGRGLVVNLIIAFIPAAVVGLLTQKYIEAHLFSVKTVAIGEVAGALLMFYAEYWRKKHAATIQIGDLTPKKALGIGLLQCASLWPGTSRSMTTIVGGYFSGLDPRKSAEFSFLLGFVILMAASIYKGLQSGATMVVVFGWTNILIGCVVSAIVAALSIRFLIHYLTRHGLGVFAVYRILIAAVLLAWFVF